MQLEFLVNVFVPVITGIFYFIMAFEVIRVSRIRKFMFGEIGYQKLFIAFIMFGIYFITRPLQNVLGPHPMPMIINSLRQFFIMGIILENGYEMKTTFWQDFSIADAFGEEAIQDTYDRSFESF